MLTVISKLYVKKIYHRIKPIVFIIIKILIKLRYFVVFKFIFFILHFFIVDLKELKYFITLCININTI